MDLRSIGFARDESAWDGRQHPKNLVFEGGLDDMTDGYVAEEEEFEPERLRGDSVQEDVRSEAQDKNDARHESARCTRRYGYAQLRASVRKPATPTPMGGSELGGDQ
ncbi:unnamed protein product [Peniophora sp. CBMAI 1063]|nr:unnamed protein product [Peniophora sp. CBMAI 1063]